MAITGFDTHETVKDLEASGFSEEQAEAIIRGLKRSQTIDVSAPATKSDVGELRTLLKADLAELRAELKADVAELRADLNQLRADMKAGLAELRAELIKWVVGIAFAQLATLIAILKLFPSEHP